MRRAFFNRLVTLVLIAAISSLTLQPVVAIAPSQPMAQPITQGASYPPPLSVWDAPPPIAGDEGIDSCEPTIQDGWCIEFDFTESDWGWVPDENPLPEYDRPENHYTENGGYWQQNEGWVPDSGKIKYASSEGFPRTFQMCKKL